MTEEEARTFVARHTDEQGMGRIEQFVKLLVQESANQNLISPSSIPSIWNRHIADAAQLVSYLPSEGHAVDFGSGPGLPGIILAILQPAVEWSLVETRRLRVEWLGHVAAALDLDNVRVLGVNAKIASRFPATAITARAFAPLPTLLEIAAGFSTSHTVWVLPKGASAAQELQALPAKHRRMFHVEQSLTQADAGVIVGKGKIEVSK